MENQPRILAVEDDADIVGLLREVATRISCSLDSRADGRSGLETALDGNYDLVVLDLQLPLMDGFAVCRELRSKLPRTPILILTSRVEETDKVLGLELGADDYVTKPFSSRELQARLRALLRRVDLGKSNASAEADEIIRSGDLLIDLYNRKVCLGPKEIPLTSTEFSLLTLLASSPGRTFTRQDLLEQIWGYRASGNEPTLSTHLSRLRHKIEPDPMKPKYIITIHGVGYRFQDPSSLASQSE